MRTEGINKNQADALFVSAGGKSSRIRPYLETEIEGRPKHLLPIPGGDFLLGAIVRNGESFFDRIIISTSPETDEHIRPAFSDKPNVISDVDQFRTGPLGPMLRALSERQNTTYGCAGDYYCDFSWVEFKSFHDQQRKPVTILLAKSSPTTEGATFKVESGNVTGWERVNATTAEDRINIGAYIVEYDKVTKPFFKAMTYHKEDPFFDFLISRGLVAGFDPEVLGFNINTFETYIAACDSITTKL